MNKWNELRLDIDFYKIQMLTNCFLSTWFQNWNAEPSGWALLAICSTYRSSTRAEMIGWETAATGAQFRWFSFPNASALLLNSATSFVCFFHAIYEWQFPQFLNKNKKPLPLLFVSFYSECPYLSFHFIFTGVSISYALLKWVAVALTVLAPTYLSPRSTCSRCTSRSIDSRVNNLIYRLKMLNCSPF